MKAIRIDIDWHPGLSIYASEPFLKMVGDDCGWLGGIDGAGKLRCILPYTIIRKAIVRMVRFRVETIPIGDGLSIEEEKSFLNSAVDYFRSIRADVIIPATTNSIFRTYPDGAVAAPYGSYIIDLRLQEDVLWGNLNSSHRRKVRLAMKQGVQVRFGMEFMKPAYELVRDTFKRSNLGFMGFGEFKRYIGGLNENVRIMIADYQGEIQCCVVIPFSDHSAYYVYGGSIPKPVTGATNLLHWEAIRYFRGLGVQRYDFVGSRIEPEKDSKQEGLAQYKQRFGGRLVQGYLWKHSLHPVKSAVYNYAVRFLRGGDIVDCEHHKLDRI